MLSYAIAVAVVCGIHRIWNYEDIFDGTRRWLERVQRRMGGAGVLLTPVLCPACNPVWIAAAVAAGSWMAGVFSAWEAVALPFAAYPVVRGLVWVYQQPLESLLKPHQCSRPQQAPPTAPPRPAAASAPATPAAPAKKGCSSCGKKAEEIKSDRAFSDTFRQRVVLMTALADFDPSYSLVSVIFDQARALAKDPKRLVQIWVMENANMTKVPAGLPANVQVKPLVPNIAWREDVIDDDAVAKLQRDLLMRLFNLGNATIITHDLMLVSWYTTFAAAIHKIGTVKAFSWIHQIHSCVGPKPELTPAITARTTLPKGHVLAVLNETEIEPAAAYYGVDAAGVVVIPNTRDVATWGTTATAQAILGATALIQADIAQVLPLSLPRAQAKGLDHVIRLHGAIRSRGRTTALVVVDAHANAADAAKVKAGYRDLATAVGAAVVFTSDLVPESAAVGVDAATVKALFGAANLFVLPSLSESAGLVALEAAVCGNHVWVNSNVPALHDLATKNGGVHEWPFPSQRAGDVAVSYDALAAGVIATVDADASGNSRRAFARTRTVSALEPAVEAAITAAKPIP